MSIKKLFWWWYKPADEREQAIYGTAYSRAYITLVSALLLFIWCSMTLFPAVVLKLGLGALGMFAAIIVSYLVGYVSIRGHDLSFTKPKRNPMASWTVMIMVWLIVTCLLYASSGRLPLLLAKFW